MAVIFPKIKSLTVYGFRKIFTNECLEIDFSKNLSIILGGNGLGKTTLLQCIIYALTGGTDNANVEENSTLRWSHTYFKGRIDDDAYVVINFFLGQTQVTLKREFNSTRVLECTIKDSDNYVIQKSSFEQVICEYGNYNSIDDFSFIVNRLLYLPENRRSILWDYDAQIRTLMIINNEFIVEGDYRILRQTIKEKDSNKRKIHWDIGRLEKRQAQKTVNLNDYSKVETSKDNHNNFVINKKNLLEKLQIQTDNSKKLYYEIRDDENTCNSLVNSISEIGNKVQTVEAAYMQTLLLEHDVEFSSVFSKTLKSGYCPACDQKSDNLKKTIIDRIKQGTCLICGEPITKLENPNMHFDIDALNSQLKEKIIARNELDVRINQNNNKLIHVEEDITTLRNELSKIDYDYSDDLLNVEDVESDDNSFNDTLIAEEYVNLCQKEKELKVEIVQLSKKADDIYDSFISNFQIRYSQLYNIYASLASEFLGVPVELAYTKSKDKFVNMNYLVPRFNGIDRDSPDACSEAQRFFLDIAFRMSIINLNKAISDVDASFICETPENALDVSYLVNVVMMFLKFIKKGGNLILTNNLQLQGIAQSLIKEAREKQITIEVFDLLKYGKLSEIQSSSKQLKDIRDSIIAEVIK